MRRADSFDNKQGIRVRSVADMSRWRFADCASPHRRRGEPADVRFRSADEAADALVKAVKARDRKAIIAILGPGAEKSIWSGDAVADRAAGERFICRLRAEARDRRPTAMRAPRSRSDPTTGRSPFRWSSPRTAGASIRKRARTSCSRAGSARTRSPRSNVMLAIADAQREYASEDRNRSGVREYARKFASTAGRKDGLYWPTKTGRAGKPARRAGRAGHGRGLSEGQRAAALTTATTSAC